MAAVTLIAAHFGAWNFADDILLREIAGVDRQCSTVWQRAPYTLLWISNAAQQLEVHHIDGMSGQLGTFC